MSELSVAARVRAHISTPYIDADGRGVRALDGTGFTSEKPACMLPPDEYHRRRVADEAELAAKDRSAASSSSGAERHVDSQPAEDDASRLLRRALAEEEARARDVEQRLAGHQRATVRLRAERYAADWQAVAAALLCVKDQRDARRDAEREERRAKLDAAYARRSESEAHMVAFLALSRPDARGELREKEEDAMRRFAALRERRAAAVAASATRVAEAERRKEREHGAVQGVLAARRKATEEREAAAAKQRFQAELAQETERRRRALELRRRREEVQVAEDLERAVWRRKADMLVASERDLAQLATAKEHALHALVIRHREAQQGAHYATLKELQAEFQRHADELRIRLEQEQKGRGTALELVMVAAKDTAKKKRVAFRGLELLATATHVSSPYTPLTRPEMDPPTGKLRNASVQCPEPTKERGRRGPDRDKDAA